MKIYNIIAKYINNNWQNETSHWLSWIPFWFALGIALYFALPFEPNMWLVLGVAELCLLLLILLRHHNGLRPILLIFLIIICGFLNIYAHTLYTEKRVHFLPHKTTYLSGIIDDISYNEKGAQRLLLAKAQDYQSPLSGYFRITVTNPHESFTIGECVEMIATVFPPSRVPTMNGFQLNRKYFYEQISAIGYSASEIFPIECASKEKSRSFKMRLNEMRQKISEKIAEVLPPDEAGVANALLIGEKSRLPSRVVENYRGAGLAHFLSVSGLHLGAIATLVFFFVRLLLALFPAIALRIDSKKPAAVAAILFSAAYLLISGMAIPAERAFIMTVVVLIGILFNRQAISLRMVSFAAFVILLIQPQALISISFQMSFAAVYALIAFYERYAGKISHFAKRGGAINRIFWYLSGIIIGDFIASLATTPFAVYHFHQVAIYTSLGNLLAGPLIGLWLMPNVLLCLLVLPFGLFKYPLLLLGKGLEILNTITADVAALPNSLLHISYLPFWGFVCIIIGGFWLCVWSQKWRILGILPILIGFVPMFFGEKPIMVVAPEGKAVAARDENGKMYLLTDNVDHWLRQVWKENFYLEDKPAAAEDLAICNKSECVYRQKIKFNHKGEFWLNDKKLNTCSGGYFYGDDKISFAPLWNCNERHLWIINIAQ